MDKEKGTSLENELAQAENVKKAENEQIETEQSKDKTKPLKEGKPAKSKKKKPKHTKLVVPGDKKKTQNYKKDRMGRNIPENAKNQKTNKTLPMADTTEKSHRNEKNQPKQPAPQPGKAPTPDNAILLPTQKKRKSRVRRKRTKRSVQFVVLISVFLAIVLVYTSGVYLTAGVLVGNVFDNLRIMLTPGKGFPAELAVPAFIEAEPMGNGGFVMLGDKDMMMVSGTGAKLNAIQHGFVNPWVTAGDTRVCVYDRGGKSYTVEGRNKNIIKGTTEEEIIFVQMSSGGYLAMVTASRYSAILQIYDPVMDVSKPEFTFPVSNGKPISLAFHSDNRHFALACLAAGEDGAVGSVIYLLQTNKNVEQAIIQVGASIPLKMHFLAANRLLVIFDGHIALYDGQGAELARYAYDGRKLITADLNKYGAALVFGSESQENISVLVLNEKLEVQGGASTDSAPSPRVLLVAEGVFLLVGQEVLAYSPEGILIDTLYVEEKTNDLVHGNEALLLTAKDVQELEYLLNKKPDDKSAAFSQSIVSSAAQSQAQSQIYEEPQSASLEIQ